jgi:hypothetical protein
MSYYYLLLLLLLLLLLPPFLLLLLLLPLSTTIGREDQPSEYLRLLHHMVDQFHMEICFVSGSSLVLLLLLLLLLALLYRLLDDFLAFLDDNDEPLLDFFFDLLQL